MCVTKLIGHGRQEKLQNLLKVALGDLFADVSRKNTRKNGKILLKNGHSFPLTHQKLWSESGVFHQFQCSEFAGGDFDPKWEEEDPAKSPKP